MTSDGQVSQEQPGYRAYLLRVWPVKEAGQVVWQASLRSVGTGKQLGFASLEDLFAYLWAETREIEGMAALT